MVYISSLVIVAPRYRTGNGSMSRISITGTSYTIPSGLFVGGNWVEGHGEVLESVNPATEEVIAKVSSALVHKEQH